jgi:virginiamycin B lyase
MSTIHGGGRLFGQRHQPLRRRLLGASIGLIASLFAPSAALAIDEFPLPAGTSSPGAITPGPDGASLWFTTEGTASIPAGIGRITTSGVITNHYVLPVGASPDHIVAGPDGRIWFTQAGRSRLGALNPATGFIDEYTTGGQPQAIVVGPDNQLWYTEVGPNRISQISTGGSIGSQYTITTPSSDPSDLVLGPDGRLWFTEQAVGASKIGALNTSIPPGPGAIAEYPTPTPGSEPSGIIPTTGGILWFTEAATGAVGRITTTGTVTEFPGAGATPSAIAAGRDGALWYTLGFGGTLGCTGTSDHAIGRITSGGTFTNKFATPTPASDPADIVTGPDGALWFSEFCGNKIGRIATAAPAPPPPPPPPVAVLSVSSLKLAPSSFKAAPRGASITKKKRKTGTKVTYRVSATASIRFTVESVQKGRKRGKKCVKPTAKNRKAKKCTRYVVARGSFKHAGKGGSNSFRFSGRVGGKRLSSGKYRLVAVATIGTRKSKVRRANFKIVR